MLFPYLEQVPLWEDWSGNFSATPPRQAPFIELLTCASNPPETTDQPWLSYVANAGWAFSDDTRSSLPSMQQTMEFAANGVFFDNYKNDFIGPVDGREGHPRISVRLASITDGSSKTLMYAESLHTWYWAYDDDRILDTKHLFGFVWSNQQMSDMEPIGGINREKNFRHSSMSDYSEPVPPLDSTNTEERYGYPSSNHAGTVNVAYGDGHVDILVDTLDPRVYAQLMTSNMKRSNLIWNVGDGHGLQPDRTLPQPSDDEY
jgi:prepilin-type processing-associated H-X9-DG protein